MKLLAFAASNSTKSINKQLATFTTTLIEHTQVELLDLNDYEMPIYSEDREQASGIPAKAQQFFDKIGNSDAVIIAYAEHNGSYSAAYKNIFDWCSRISQKLFQNKPLVLLSTSGGARGGSTVLKTATDSAVYFAGNVVASLAVPNFYDIFDLEKGLITDDAIKQQLTDAVNKLVK